MLENALDQLLVQLTDRPGEAYIAPNGSFLALLGGPHEDQLCIILPTGGKNFNEMTDEEVNTEIQITLKKGFTRL